MDASDREPLVRHRVQQGREHVHVAARPARRVRRRLRLSDRARRSNIGDDRALIDIPNARTAARPANPVPATPGPAARRARPRPRDGSPSRSPPRAGFGSSRMRTRRRSTRGWPRRSRPPSPMDRPPGSFISAPPRSPPRCRPRWASSGTTRGSSSPGSAPSVTSRSGAPRWRSQSRRASSTDSSARPRR